jgi:hypothetical protein
LQNQASSTGAVAPTSAALDPPLHRMFHHYSEMPYSQRVLFTSVLLVLGLGYLFALTYIFVNYAGRAGGNPFMLTYNESGTLGIAGVTGNHVVLSPVRVDRDRRRRLDGAELCLHVAGDDVPALVLARAARGAGPQWRRYFFGLLIGADCCQAGQRC